MSPEEIIDRLADVEPFHHCIGFPEMDECQFCGATGPAAIRERRAANRTVGGPLGTVAVSHNPDCIWYAARSIRRGVPA